jgi:hypothetical protein
LLILREPEKAAIPLGYAVDVTVSNKYFSAPLKLCVYDHLVAGHIASEQEDEVYADAEGAILTLARSEEVTPNEQLGSL